mmetsp:Transcript_18741/g.23012  ORF Transcript_18741/g.23012 Transcript_18741/m.23012 type:complete len:464 (-) Transcript_18741:142-1533(-)
MCRVSNKNEQEQEILVPPHDSPRRQSKIVAATFNLIATIIGGGVLSLPLAFRACGLVLGTVLMVTSACMTVFSMDLLCFCARRMGSKSYVELTRHAFGRECELATTVLLAVFLWFVIVAYMVLVKDIWTPFFRSFFSSSHPNMSGDTVLLIMIALVSPFFLKHDLHSLRYNCYVGFFSITILAFALVTRAVQTNLNHPDLFGNEATFVTSDPYNALYVFPIISFSYISQFNVISVQSALVNPTKERTKTVMNSSILICFILTFVFGVAGYLVNYDGTKGNILLNFDESDKFVNMGRLGSGITLTLAMPMICLPCRESFLGFLGKYRAWREERKQKRLGECLPLVVIDTAYIEQESSNKEEPLQNGMDLLHIFSSLAIISTCYIAAVSTQRVSTVWSYVGSSMGFTVAFILPSACYIKLFQNEVENKNHSSKLVAAKLMLFSTILGAVVCTAQTFFFPNATSLH